jgi:hypothetical protein
MDTKFSRKEFSDKVVSRRLELIQKVLQAKGTEYGADKTAFHNFEEATGISLHSKKTSAAWEMCVKHLVSIKDIITDYETKGIVPSEALLEEKLGDAINYFILLEGMFKEIIANQPKEVKVKYSIGNE